MIRVQQISVNFGLFFSVFRHCCVGVEKGQRNITVLVELY